jgi:hypothetical protein
MGSNSTRLINITFLQPLTGPALSVCHDDPWGGMESGDPIVQMTPVPPPPDEPPPDIIE